MSTVMPQSELLKQAVSWISERMREPRAVLARLVDEAGMRFNLSPKDQDFLRDFFKGSPKGA